MAEENILDFFKNSSRKRTSPSQTQNETTQDETIEDRVPKKKCQICDDPLQSTYSNSISDSGHEISTMADSMNCNDNKNSDEHFNPQENISNSDTDTSSPKPNSHIVFLEERFPSERGRNTLA